MAMNTIFRYSCFSVFVTLCISSANSYVYNEHCSSIIPESSPTVRAYTTSIPYIRTSYFTGGDELVGRQLPSNHSYYNRSHRTVKSIRFPISPILYQTRAKGIYKVEANLYFFRRYYDIGGRNSSSYGSYYVGSGPGESGLIRFKLSGFWSELSGKLCMIGEGNSLGDEGEVLSLSVLLKLKLASDDSDMYNSAITGTLESIDSSPYFELVSLFSFPEISYYKYSLVSPELFNKRLGDGGDDFEVEKNQSLVLESSSFCSMISFPRSRFDLEYAPECNRSERGCSPLGGFLPRFLTMNTIQCSNDERKVRFMMSFQNSHYSSFFRDFDVNSTYLAEGYWDEKSNRILIVACRLLNLAGYSENVVGDCALRLSLRYPSVWTIRHTEKIVGQIWTNKSVDDSGYFRKIKASVNDVHDMLALPRLRYEYTVLDKVGSFCSAKTSGKKDGNRYPDGHSYDMRFDLSVKNAKGQQFAWAYGEPLSVGTELRYGRSSLFSTVAPEASVTISEPETSPKDQMVNISYKMTINAFDRGNLSIWVPSSLTFQGQVELNLEGVYNSKTGQLCMIGCKKVISNGSFDCTTLVNFEFPPLNDLRGGGLVKGTIRSTRKKGDPLYFEELSLSSGAYYRDFAERSIWRMDMEIIMVLISNTLFCIFVGLQIFHVKMNPEVLSSISVLMVLILTLGLVIPLILNFEALFLDGHEKERLYFGGGGWLEANKITIRVVLFTMVAFLLQVRLLQLVWTVKMSARENDKAAWDGEKKALFVSVPIYIVGGLLAMLLNWTRNQDGHQSINIPNSVDSKYSNLGYLRSYAGLIFDGFLIPQVLVNAFRGLAEKALAHPYYIGTSMIRVVPHAYDQYRAHSYPATFVNGTYYYANHSTDFYSTAWDVIIPVGVMVLAVIIFLQQCRGGRCILPKRFRELQLYEKVPAVVNNGV